MRRLHISRAPHARYTRALCGHEWYACEHATYTPVIWVCGRVYVGEQEHEQEQEQEAEQAGATASSSAALHILVACNILVASDTYLVICGHE